MDVLVDLITVLDVLVWSFLLIFLGGIVLIGQSVWMARMGVQEASESSSSLSFQAERQQLHQSKRRDLFTHFVWSMKVWMLLFMFYIIFQLNDMP